MLRSALTSLFLLPFFLFAQEVSDSLTWSGKLLTKEHFKGRSDTAWFASNHHAVTYWQLHYRYKPVKTSQQVIFIVYAWMDTRRSWIRPSFSNSASLIRHEQGHFDLAEVLARRFRKKLLESTLNGPAFADSVKSLFAQQMADNKSLQQQYDEDTVFGENLAEQEAWQKKIAGMLEELAAFSRQEIRVKWNP